MVDWWSDASVAKQNGILFKIDMILFGIFLWESIVTLWYDVAILSGRRPFKWPVLVYWLTKYSTLAFLIAANIINNAGGFLVTQTPINCQANEWIIDLASRCAMAGASCLFLIRALALWKQDLRVTIPLVLLHLAQWGFYLHNSFMIKETWSTEENGCHIYTITVPWLKAQFIYTMVFDFLVLAAATWALLRLPGRANLWKILVLDGLSYYLGAFLIYLGCTLVAFLNTGTYFMLMWSDTATVLVSILACRSFVRVATYHIDGSRAAGGNPTPANLPTSGAHIEFKRPTNTAGGTSTTISNMFTRTFARSKQHSTSDSSDHAYRDGAPVLSFPNSDSDLEAQSEKK